MQEMLSPVSSHTVFQRTADYCKTEHWQSDRYPTRQEQLYKHISVCSELRTALLASFIYTACEGNHNQTHHKRNATLCLTGSQGCCGSLAGGKRLKRPKTQRNKLILSISLIISVVQHFCVLSSEKAINNWRQLANGTSCYPLEGFLEFFPLRLYLLRRKGDGSFSRQGLV